MAEKGTARTTISLAGDLKARMEKVKESVNWSALACRAFEEKLAEIAARKENKAMNDVVERLRATLRDQQNESFKEGYEAGRTWGENTATVAQLKRLETFQKTTKANSQSDWDSWFCSEGTPHRWIALVEVIQGNRSIHARTALAFWNDVAGEQPRDGDFFRGFVEGAVDLWAKVREQL
jgi:hypothetical protein